MLVRIIHVKVRPEAASDFEAACEANHRGSIAEPGVLRFDVLREEGVPGSYVLYEAYRDQNATVAHKETEHYRVWRETVAPMMAGDRTSAAYSVVAPDDPASW